MLGGQEPRPVLSRHSPQLLRQACISRTQPCVSPRLQQKQDRHSASLLTSWFPMCPRAQTHLEELTKATSNPTEDPGHRHLQNLQLYAAGTLLTLFFFLEIQKFHIRGSYSPKHADSLDQKKWRLKALNWGA